MDDDINSWGSHRSGNEADANIRTTFSSSTADIGAPLGSMDVWLETDCLWRLTARIRAMERHFFVTKERKEEEEEGLTKIVIVGTEGNVNAARVFIYNITDEDINGVI